MKGVEPSRPYRHWPLMPAWLPLHHIRKILVQEEGFEPSRVLNPVVFETTSYAVPTLLHGTGEENRTPDNTLMRGVFYH